MSERIYCVRMPDGRTFKCVESQLMKDDYICPITKKPIDPATLRVAK